MLSTGDDDVITPLALDTNENLPKITQLPGGEAEDVRGLVSPWEIKPNRRDRATAQQVLLQLHQRLRTSCQGGSSWQGHATIAATP